MSSINCQIDNAVEVMKVRAAEFDDKWSMNGVTSRSDFNLILARADKNLSSAKGGMNIGSDKPLHMSYVDRKKKLADVMNLCALAMSILPED